MGKFKLQASDLKDKAVTAFKGDGSKTNWEKVRDRKLQDDPRYRDIYEEQQLDRAKVEKKQAPTSRIIFTIITTILIMVMLWFVCAAGGFAMAKMGLYNQKDTYPLVYNPNNSKNYMTKDNTGYYELTEMGEIASGPYNTSDEVPYPQWYKDSADKYAAQHGGRYVDNYWDYFWSFNIYTFLLIVGVGAIYFAIVYTAMMRNLKTQNLMVDNSDINDYRDDRYVSLPDEVLRKYDWFPDAGAHSPTNVQTILSHVACSNKGIKKVELTQRYEEDVMDDEDETNVLYYKGEPIYDEETGELVKKKVDMFNFNFMEDLYEASGVTAKEYKVYRDLTKIPYNVDNNNRDKTPDCDSVADLVNKTWFLPDYETQTPAGAYIVDTAPVHCLVVAITRAGKGQTVIEPTIDMWLREDPVTNNIVCNDPKGELMVKFYVPATRRGFQVVQLNLINSDSTDIYNPLAMAIQAARRGDVQTMSSIVTNVTDVFFPADAGDDPVWNNAASNCTKRSVFALIDYFLEEEKYIRKEMKLRGKLDTEIEVAVDNMWAKCSLYNCYQMLVKMSAKQTKDPLAQTLKDLKENKYGMYTPEYPTDDQTKLIEEATEKSSKFWNGSPSVDNLTLYFNVCENFPESLCRTEMINANNSLKSMGAAEKMLASVYGIAITALAFFTDPTISSLTSGPLSQTIDFESFSFPRRMGFKLETEYIKLFSLRGAICKWQAYSDDKFEHSLGKDFFHEGQIDKTNWCDFYFKGIHDSDVFYVKCEVVNKTSRQLVQTFHFKFTKGYQLSLDGRRYMKDPILGEKIVQNGTLEELTLQKSKSGKRVYKHGHVLFKKLCLDYGEEDGWLCRRQNVNAILQTQVSYVEKPKILFLVSPPHLVKYISLLLIAIQQLIQTNLGNSYLTKPNQKPLFGTKYMLDEFGNLKSDGHGIEALTTDLSISLGQCQFLTLILQTLQQLQEVYGDNSNKVIQGNAEPLWAKLATPFGWRKMGNVKVGDVVLTPYGKTTKVTGVYPRGVRKVYKVTRKDGAVAYACNEHLWNVKVK